jgi:hypothetical protein
MENYFMPSNAGKFTVLMGEVIHIIGLLVMIAMRPDMNGVKASFLITVKIAARPLNMASITLKRNSINEGSLSGPTAYPQMRPAV